MKKEKNKNMFASLQRIGKSFMLPIAVLPVAGILLGLGSSFTNITNLKNMGLLEIMGPGSFSYNIFNIMGGVGSAVFDNLPLIFAVGVAIGMSDKQKETAALAGALAYITMNVTINKLLIMVNLVDEVGNIINASSSGMIGSVLGITTLETGAFGGIIVGLMVAYLHNRFYDIKLPDSIAFFGGNRFVPIVSVFGSLILGLIFSILWPYVALFISNLGVAVAKGGVIGAFLYDFIKRLLIPFGLHHIFYLPFWQTALGGTMEIAGEQYVGAQNILFAQLADPNTAHISRNAAMYFDGLYPIMLIALPVACFVMYKNAKDINKKVVKSLLFSAAAASFITGITEPVEFPIMFASPILYVVHCILSGLSSAVLYSLNVGVGCTFSSGLIDLLLFGILPGNAKTSWVFIIPVGIIFGLLYYFIFNFAIKKFDLKTPGREEIDSQVKINALKEDASELILSGLGGIENIINLDCCATRLRVEIRDQKRISESDLRNTGALGIMLEATALQVIYGPGVNNVKTKLENYLGSDYHNSVLIRSPLIGKYIKMENVPDDAFANKLMGEGIAVDPDEETVFAPADGTIEFLYPTCHAIGFKCKDGTNILIHIGIDTVNLKGQGFTPLVKQGDEVKLGTPMIKMDLNFLRKNAKSMVSPIIITDLADNQKIEIVADNHIEYNETVLRISEK